MTHHITRQDLYERVWSTPMTQLVLEFDTTAAVLSALLRRADIPSPSSGHWMKKQFGKPVLQPPLPPAPSGCDEPLVLGPIARTIYVRRAEKPASLPVREAPAAKSSVPPSAPPQEMIGSQTRLSRPTQPTTLTRDELYTAVWETPMSRLAKQYGISGNGLAKICAREGIPYPPRGYWTKHAVGKASERLPALGNGRE